MTRKTMKWHCIIPFYCGTNYWVTRKGGAPRGKKRVYLQRTVDSLCTNLPHADITVFVCDRRSRETAAAVVAGVMRLECRSRHLPYQTLLQTVADYGREWPDDDRVLFTEDDQVLYMAPGVVEDIEEHGNRFVFSPHRWYRTYWLRELLSKPRSYDYLNGTQGVIDNYDRTPALPVHRFRHGYAQQRGIGGAYAACWATSMGVLRALDLHVPEERIKLESASFAVYSRRFPVLKPAIHTGTSLETFAVDHLSGHDFQKRIVYTGKMFAKRARRRLA
jgi:hypothetical protein